MVSRRKFLRNSAVAACLSGAGCAVLGGMHGILDTHTHFYDPTRPEGIPWPPKDDAVLYRPVLPEEYRRLAQPLGITGTLVVEASPRESDNDWVLNLAARDRFLVGLVGHLKPGQPGFARELDRLARNPLFRGIRTGGWEGGIRVNDPVWIQDLRRVSDHGLTLDLLVGPSQMPEAVRLAAAIPKLRIVIDHCANVRMGPPPHDPAWVDGVVACHYRDNVFMKISGLVEGTGRSDGTAPRDLEVYRPVLDTLWRVFGEDRLVFGSNWPVSARFAPLGTVVGIVDDYLREKGYLARSKVFSRNAASAYQLASR